MKLWVLTISLPKSNTRERNRYVEEVVVLAESLEAAKELYGSHLKEIDAERSRRQLSELGERKIVKGKEYSGRWVSRGIWKDTSSEKLLSPT